MTALANRGVERAALVLAILVALTGLAGMFIGGRRLRKEKEDSYNAGLKKAGVVK